MKPAPATLSPAALATRERLLARIEQREFDYFVPEKFMRLRWLNIKQVAEMLGYNRRTAARIAEENICDEHGRPTGIPKLERQDIDGRDRSHARFTLRGVLLYLVERLASDPKEHTRRIERVVEKMDAAQLTHFIQFATARRARL